VAKRAKYSPFLKAVEEEANAPAIHTQESDINTPPVAEIIRNTSFIPLAFESTGRPGPSVIAFLDRLEEDERLLQRMSKETIHTEVAMYRRRVQIAINKNIAALVVRYDINCREVV